MINNDPTNSAIAVIRQQPQTNQSPNAQGNYNPADALSTKPPVSERNDAVNINLSEAALKTLKAKPIPAEVEGERKATAFNTKPNEEINPAKLKAAKLSSTISLANTPPQIEGNNKYDADINGDGVVDTYDLNQLLANWSTEPNKEAQFADIDGDGLVNESDLEILLKNWTT